MDTLIMQRFIEVARRGSFAAVARDHDVDPSAVSRMIQALEEELGVRLFQRTTRSLALTEAGRRYLESIEPMLDGLESARQALRDENTTARGLLRITTSVSFAQHCLVPLLPRFMAANPELELELLIADSMLDVITDRIDLAIRLGPGGAPSLAAQSALVVSQLMPVKYRVCASPVYLERQGPVRTPQDIARLECLLFPLPGFRTAWKFRNRRGEVSEIPVRGRVVISAATAIRDCAVNGMGVALLPQWLVDPELASGSLVDIFPRHDVTASNFDTAVWLMYPSRSFLPHKVRVFIDFLRSSVALPAA